ncbi:hypothetical protein K1719_046973 [Acacia pycnantha]|nr:hypothetical protein K1719_046973 [Acacia pycnantha]
MLIAIPSFALLYSMDEVVVDPAITIKAIGHQWYRTYEYSDYNSSDEQSLTFDSYTIPEDDLELGQSRLLEVDNRVVVPAKTHLRINVTPADVPHSWAVPSLGVKCDAVPGPLNRISISVQREGVYYGQCSELHSAPLLMSSHGPNSGWTDILLGAEEDSTAQQLAVVPSGGSPAGVWTHFEDTLESSGRSSSNPSVNQPGEQAMPPTSPVASGEAEPAPAPPLAPPGILPQLEPPLISDEERIDVLRSRYVLLNLGGDDGLSRMSSIISHQLFIERSIEAALVDDGFNRISIIHKYSEIRGVLHSPQGELLSERTYRAHVNQIREQGTRESVPYRRVIQAVKSSRILLERADGGVP